MTTITAEATAADLLAELRELVDRYDGTETLDDVRKFADEVTARLRRARGRISRIVKAEAPPAPVVEPAPKPEPAKPATVSHQEKVRPAAVVDKPPESAPAAASARPRPAPRRRTTPFHLALAVLTAVAVVWSTTTTPTGRATRATVRAIRSGARHAGRFATAIRSTLSRLGGAS